MYEILKRKTIPSKEEGLELRLGRYALDQTGAEILGKPTGSFEYFLELVKMELTPAGFSPTNHYPLNPGPILGVEEEAHITNSGRFLSRIQLEKIFNMV